MRVKLTAEKKLNEKIYDNKVVQTVSQASFPVGVV
jgi:hypothetical protein